VWALLGTLGSLAAAVAPDYLLAWALILFLSVDLVRHGPILDGRVLALIAGVSLIDTFAQLSLLFPARGWLEAPVLTRPLRRWLLIQLPCQALAIPVVELFGTGVPARAPLAVAGGVLVGVLALLGLTLALLGGPSLRTRGRRSAEGSV
jgi:hypothetical protein